MENYSKGSNLDEPWDLAKVPIPNIPEDITWMKVSPGSKMKNLLEFALNDYKSKDVILWSGSGPAVGKTISCVEIMKQKCQNLHQISLVCYRKETEYWNPLIETLDQLKVTREIPTIHILLSKVPLDSRVSGYQEPGNKCVFWKSQLGSFQKSKRYAGEQKTRSSCGHSGLIRNKKSRAKTEQKLVAS